MGKRLVSNLQKVMLLVTYSIFFHVNHVLATDLPIRVGGTTYIMPINKPPVSEPDTYYVNEYGNLCDDTYVDNSNNRCNHVIDVLANDSDEEGDALTLVATSTANSGTVSIWNNKAVYTPTTSFFTPGSDSFTYEAKDSSGNITTGSVSLIVNRAPLVSRDGFSIPSTTTGSPICNENYVDPNNCRFVFDPLANDPADPEGDQIAQIITSRNKFYGDYADILIFTPSNGLDYGAENDMKIEFHVTTTCMFGGVPAGGCDYGSRSASSTYRVVDSRGAVSKIGVVGYAPDNHPPVVVDDANINVLANTPITIDVLANDSDADGNAISIVRIKDFPQHGTAVIQGNQIVYTPATDYVGSDYFPYEIKDTLNLKANGFVYVNVINPNNPPIANNDSVQTHSNETVTIDVLANDSDPESQVIRIVDISMLPMHGVAVIDNGQIKYTPDTNHYGTDEFIYRIQDASGAFASASVTIQILAAPSVTTTSPIDGHKYTNAENINATATASDLDGTISALKFKLSSDTVWQEDTIAPYENNYGILPIGNYSIQYQAIDNQGYPSLIKTVNFEITPPVTVSASWDVSSIIVGQSATLTWSSTGATECSSSTELAVTGTSGSHPATFYSIGTFDTLVTCSNSTSGQSNNITATITVNKLGAPQNLGSQQ